MSDHHVSSNNLHIFMRMYDVFLCVCVFPVELQTLYSNCTPRRSVVVIILVVGRSFWVTRRLQVQWKRKTQRGHQREGGSCGGEGSTPHSCSMQHVGRNLLVLPLSFFFRFTSKCLAACRPVFGGPLVPESIYYYNFPYVFLVRSARCTAFFLAFFCFFFLFWQIASGNCGNNLQLTKYEDQLLEHDLCACDSAEGNQKKRGNKFINLCKISRLQSFRHCNLIFMVVRLCIYGIHSSVN